MANRFVDSVLGKKVEGKVSAILPPSDQNSLRYIVETKKGFFDVNVPLRELQGGLWHQTMTIVFNPIFKRGEEVRKRLRNVHPWTNGQRV